MTVSSLATSPVQNPITPAVVLNATSSPAMPFMMPSTGSSGASKGASVGSLGASLSGGLSGALNAALIQLQQAAPAIPATSPGQNPPGAPGSGVHHHHRHGDGDGDRTSAAAGTTTGTGQGQTADAAAAGAGGTTPNGPGGLLSGDMAQALQSYASLGGAMLGG